MELKLDDIGFLGLANFWLLALVSILAGLALLNERRKLILLGIKGSQLLTILIALALLTTGVAQLRPYLGFKEFKLFGASSDLLLLVDVSSSMLTKDLSAARLEVAKRKIHSLLNRVRKVRYGDRVGIVAFAGSAYLFCPLTSDYAAVELFSRSLAPELISAQGSDISQALEVAIKVIDESNAAHSSLIILSDGEDSDFNPDQIRSLIKERKLEINALAFGTLAGMPIEGSNANFIKDNNNQVIISKLNPDTLKSVVKIGSGSYLEAKISDDDIESLIKAKQPPLPDADSTNNLEQVTLRNYNELGPLLCAIALGLLTFCAWRKPRALFSLLLLIILSSGDFLATNAQASPAKGYQHYQAKEYEKSVEIFEQELKHDPDNYKLKLALGNSYYRLGRFKEAQKAYQEAQQLSKKWP
jgi:Ca-activated chloride channel family protein